MAEKRDLESPWHTMTPTMEDAKSSNCRPQTILYPAVRLGPRRTFRKSFIAFFSVVIAIALLLLYNPLPTPIAGFSEYILSRLLPGGEPDTSRTSAGKIIKVATLPHHLIPDTYNRHSSSNRRLVVVGDVHGVHLELTQLLAHISFNASNDHLILAGDMINKGPESHAVIALARSLNASGVRGNHEDKILAVRDAYDADPALFVDDDSRELKVAMELSKKDAKWLKQCPLILRLGKLHGMRQKETVVVHAGLLPLVDLHEQKPFDVMHMRSISKLTGKGKGKTKHSTAKFRAFENRHEGDDPWWKVWNQVQARLDKDERTLVLYGHDSHTGLIEKQWSIGLDSGCVSGGRLSALVIEGKDEKTGAMRMKVESVECREYRPRKDD